MERSHGLSLHRLMAGSCMVSTACASAKKSESVYCRLIRSEASSISHGCNANRGASTVERRPWSIDRRASTVEHRPWSIDLIPRRHLFFAPTERDIYSDEHTR